jgi:hypothetical protein
MNSTITLQPNSVRFDLSDGTVAQYKRETLFMKEKDDVISIFNNNIPVLTENVSNIVPTFATGEEFIAWWAINIGSTNGDNIFDIGNNPQTFAVMRNSGMEDSWKLFNGITDIDNPDIWNAPPSAAETLNIISDSTEDSPTGTGLRSLIVIGVGTDGEVVFEFVSLNGTTAVTTTIPFLRVNLILPAEVGSLSFNQGVIRFTNQTGTELNRMLAKTNSLSYGLLACPKGYVAKIKLVNTAVVGTDIIVCQIGKRNYLPAGPHTVLAEFVMGGPIEFETTLQQFEEIVVLCKSTGSATSTQVTATFETRGFLIPV